MSIIAISRDWGIVPSMVRLQSTDSLAVVSASGYITLQVPNTTLINNGIWEWLVGDLVAVQASDSDGIYQISNDFSSLLPLGSSAQLSSVNGLTAHAGGGQGSATALSLGVNRVTTVATTGDSVLLPHALPGEVVIVINASANTLDVYPQVGESANEGSATNAAVTQATHKTYTYYCALAGQWSALLSA